MSHPPPLPAPLYLGSVNTWECDEGGHLNVRFQYERALFGLAHLARALGMPRAFASGAGATLVVRDAHVRFLKEARPGEPLILHGGIVSMAENKATLCLDMRHADGAPASAFTLKVSHVDTRDFRPFAWSKRTQAAAQVLMCAPPAHAGARSIDRDAAPSDISLARAKAAGALHIGSTLIQPADCDAFGRMRGEHVFGRVSDSVPNLLAASRREIAGQSTPAGAVVEARLVFRRWPRPGDLIEIHSGIVEVGEKTQRIVHWLCDPHSGAAWASMEAVALTFDVATRKTIAPSAEARAALQKRVIAMSV